MSRRHVGGYYWHQHIADAMRAEQHAREQVTTLKRLVTNGTVTAHLLDIVLDLGTIRAALSDLKDIDNADIIRPE